MTDHTIATHEQWLAARLELLAAEKEFTRQRDALTRRRMAMPWERVEKSYSFEGPTVRCHSPICSTDARN
jgi:predicted dithiol-disulfide oxidoreductase (DUF899 family)